MFLFCFVVVFNAKSPRPARQGEKSGSTRRQPDFMSHKNKNRNRRGSRWGVRVLLTKSNRLSKVTADAHSLSWTEKENNTTINTAGKAILNGCYSISCKRALSFVLLMELSKISEARDMPVFLTSKPLATLEKCMCFSVPESKGERERERTRTFY